MTDDMRATFEGAAVRLSRSQFDRLTAGWEEMTGAPATDAMRNAFRDIIAQCNGETVRTLADGFAPTDSPVYFAHDVIAEMITAMEAHRESDGHKFEMIDGMHTHGTPGEANLTVTDKTGGTTRFLVTVTPID